jgi:hypothetical protein
LSHLAIIRSPSRKRGRGEIEDSDDEGEERRRSKAIGQKRSSISLTPVASPTVSKAKHKGEPPGSPLGAIDRSKVDETPTFMTSQLRDKLLAFMVRNMDLTRDFYQDPKQVEFCLDSLSMAAAVESSPDPSREGLSGSGRKVAPSLGILSSSGPVTKLKEALDVLGLDEADESEAIKSGALLGMEVTLSHVQVSPFFATTCQCSNIS